MLWKTSLLLRSPRPAWQGLMQNVYKCESHPGKSSVIFLPIIDLNPHDMVCMHSTLSFISNHAQQHQVTPIVTFDQPLYWNAMLVKANSSINNIVIRLGGFHSLMSFLGCIGHTMAGAGLTDALEIVYAKNTAEHITSGKAVSRAIRGHLLITAALHTLIIMLVYNDTGFQLNYDEISVDHPDIIILKDVYDKLVSGIISIDDLQSNQMLSKLYDELENKKASLSSSRTSKLWLQYVDMVDIVMNFIWAERTAENFTWDLHLATLRQMEPYFAACGHNNYAKSVYIYLEEMASLDEDHPEVYQFFQAGHHAIRRSDHDWDGIWTDLIIEQCLMRSLKTSGGLTRGRGVDELQRVIWLLSAPVIAEVHEAMQKLTGTYFVTSEQHKEMGSSRQNRDCDDTYKLINFFKRHDPFIVTSILRNIVTGVSAPITSNADDAKNVGHHILNDMIGKKVLEYTFKRKNQLRNLDTNVITVNGVSVPVNNEKIFQRFVTAASSANIDLSEAIKYELCPFPPALFQGKHTMHEAKKTALADALWNLVAPCTSENNLEDDEPTETVDTNDTGSAETNMESATINDPANAQYVLDGGALLHRIPWSINITFWLL